MCLLIAIPFTASLIASILSVVPQTNVVEKIGDFKCGNGCKYQIRFEQLSPMEEIGNGWRKVKLIKRTFFWNHELQKFEQKGFRDPPKHPHAGSWRGWNYANCTTKQFTFRSVNYSVEPPPPVSSERNSFVVLNSSPVSSTESSSAFEQWRAMCQATD